jgi:hypothetical protein
MDFDDATELTLNQGTLMFHARQDSEDSAIHAYITNIAFLWIE